MDIANRFDNPGGAIATLRDMRNAEAETDFNNMMNEIDAKASEDESLYGTVMKAGASITAVGAIGKSVVKGIQKLKAQISGKNSEKEGGDDEAEEADGTEMESYQTAPTQPTETQVAGGEEADVADAEPTETPGLFDQGPNPFRGEEDEDVPGFEETDQLAENVPAEGEGLFGEDTGTSGEGLFLGIDEFPGAGGDVVGEEGEAFTGVPTEGAEAAADFSSTVDTSQTAGGLLQPTGATTSVPEEATFDAAEGAGDAAEDAVDLGADATLDAAADGATSIGNTISSLISSATSAVGDVANTASAVASSVSSAVDAATNAATTGLATGAEVGGEVAGEVAAGTALEAAGAAADAGGVTAPIGIILNIIGGLILGGTMTAGIVGDVDAGNEQQSASAAAQDQLKSATSGAVAGVAGRYAV